MSKEMALILSGYAAAVTLALLIALSLRRERYHWPPYFDWEWDERYRRRRDGGGPLIFMAAVAVFIVLALQATP